MTNPLVCFTNCLLVQEDGSFLQKDLWVDASRGVILDAQHTFFARRERPDTIIDLAGNILAPGLIDIQLNGAYGFDFSVFDGDETAYQDGMKLVAERIVETGVTSLLPTIITQEKSLYPKLLSLLRPYSTPTSASLLGWHAEGPFLSPTKRGAHASPLLLDAPEGYTSVESIYGTENLVDAEDWSMSPTTAAVRMITVAPELQGIMPSIKELSKRGVVVSIGHSIATSEIATAAVKNGVKAITHLFNAMPQLHHRDPAIIGLLGASPCLATPFEPITSGNPAPPIVHEEAKDTAGSEAFDNIDTPPQSPLFEADKDNEVLADVKGKMFDRPFYGIIVDGIHCHPNSVRLAYSAHPAGCILITDAQKILDPNLRDGVHPWRDGISFVKEGDKLYLEGTTTLAGSVVTLDKCVRNFAKFTGCTLGQAIKCATYNPAKCLGIENRKGTLRPGADADFVVLDKNGRVVATWVRGREVWSRAK